jgi:4-hydroxy-4-methyl-2-oxoglutarate aldolase
MKTAKEGDTKVQSAGGKRVPKEIINQFLKIEDITSTISDVFDSLGICGAIPCSILKPVLRGKKIVGPAVTLKHIPDHVNPTDALNKKEKSKMKVLDIFPLCQEGDVVVIDGGGRFDVSSMGELVTLLMKRGKMAGSIVDCGVRDISSIEKLDFPVWSRGVTPITGKMRFDTIEINGPVSCAGIPVRPGDLIIADDTGVTVIPLERVDEVLRRTMEMSKAEEKLIEAIHQGKSLPELANILPKEKW